MIPKKLYCIMSAILLLTTAVACNSGTSEKLIEFESSSDNYVVTSVNDDRKNYNAYTSLATLDGSYLYVYGMRMDLAHRIIGYDCNLIGCKHNTDVCEVPARRERTFQHSFNGGMYYAEGKDVYYEKDDARELIYQNSYATSFASDTYDIPETVTGFIPYVEDKFIVINYNAVFILDTKNNTASDPIEIGNMTIDSVALFNEKTLAVCNMNMELYIVHLDTYAVEKCADYALYVQADDGYLYYVSIDNQQRKLIQYDIESKSETVITENVASFCVFESTLVYTEHGEETILYRLDKNTPDSEAIYTLDKDRAGDGGRIINILYFPGYDNLILEIASEPAAAFFEYTLLNIDTWQSEYIDCEL